MDCSEICKYYDTDAGCVYMFEGSGIPKYAPCFTKTVYGEWIAGKEIAREMIGESLLDIDYENYKCSVCGLIIDRLLYCCDGSLFYKYCPNCGARMDGKI